MCTKINLLLTLKLVTLNKISKQKNSLYPRQKKLPFLTHSQKYYMYINAYNYPLKQMEHGKPYTTKPAFSCPDQLNAFKTLLENMATKADEYISTDVRQTNNTPEGYHGIALSYRDKRIDLGSMHYQCKTNMPIPHKVSSSHN